MCRSTAITVGPSSGERSRVNSSRPWFTYSPIARRRFIRGRVLPYCTRLALGDSLVWFAARCRGRHRRCKANIELQPLYSFQVQITPVPSLSHENLARALPHLQINAPLTETSKGSVESR